MKRESLYCPCGHPIKVTCYSHLAFFRDMNGCGVDRCPSCRKILEYKNLVELGGLKMKRAKYEVVHNTISEYECPFCHVRTVGAGISKSVTRFKCELCGNELVVEVSIPEAEKEKS